MMTTTTADNDEIMADDVDIGIYVDADHNSTANTITAAAGPKLQYSDDVIDVDDLLGKFGLIHKDANLIAGKPTIVFFGGTGAGKTTTASFLAGATFELEFVGGFVHFKPTESSNESLKKFKVCGGATSVTASIQTTEVVLEDVNGKRITIIICDTPGFNDTKGPVMEISNGYGTIAAVQGASSIKPVVVINHRTMDSDRFAPLRQIVSNVIAMMGGDGSRSIDFSPFAYVFTHCEDRTKRHIAAQISFFLKTIHNDPNMKNMAMFPTLVAMLTDMISKTGPDDVICIDPEKPEEAPDILRKLWNGSTRIENPADTFVNFCSKESMSALIAQINIMIVRIENSFSGSNDLDCAETNLRKMVRLAEGLSLPEVDEAVKKGTIKAQQFVDALSTNIKNLPTHIDYRFEQTLDDMSSKLRLLAQTSGIRDICKMDFDYKLFVNGITEKLFSFTRQPIINLDQTIPGGENIIQQSIIRFGSTLQSFRDIMGDSEVEKEYSTMVKTMEDLMTPFISVLNKQLNENDPTSTELKENVSNLNFVLTMKGFFHSSKFAALELDITRWTSFETELKNILDNITDNSQSCVTHLTNLDNVLQEELLGLAAPWSCSSILKLDNIAEYKEYRDFLHVVSSSEHLVVCLLRDYSTLDIVNLIHDFDDTVTKYVEPNLVSFLEKSYLAVFENKSGEMNDRMNEAKNIIEYVNKMLVIAETLEELDPIKYRKVSSKMNCLNTKLAFFIEELKNNPIRRRSNLIPGKSLEPTENELRESKNKRHLRAWYSKCNELKAYRKKFGHCSVPSRYPKNKSLGQWVSTQRKAGVKYEADQTKSTLTKEKIEHLENLDFQWSVKENNDVVWNRLYEEVKKYKDEHGRFPPHIKGSKIGNWVNGQRTKKHIRAAHTADRKAKLRSLGSFHY